MEENTDYRMLMEGLLSELDRLRMENERLRVADRDEPEGNVLSIRVSSKEFHDTLNGSQHNLYVRTGHPMARQLVDEEAMVEDMVRDDFDDSTLCRDLLQKHVRHFDWLMIECPNGTYRIPNPTIRVGEQHAPLFGGATPCFIIEWRALESESGIPAPEESHHG